MDQDQILKIIKKKRKVSYEEIKAQAQEANIPMEIFEKAWEKRIRKRNDEKYIAFGIYSLLFIAIISVFFGIAGAFGAGPPLLISIFSPLVMVIILIGSKLINIETVAAWIAISIYLFLLVLHIYSYFLFGRLIRITKKKAPRFIPFLYICLFILIVILVSLSVNNIGPEAVL